MMDKKRVEKYAQLLSTYCLSLNAGQRLLIRSTALATPLLQAVYAAFVSQGVSVETDLSFEGQSRLYYENASSDLLGQAPLLYPYAIDKFDAVLTIDAPYDVHALSGVASALKSQRAAALGNVKKRFMERSAAGELQWALCVYPTESQAKASGMSLDMFTEFVANACALNDADPVAYWQNLGKDQQRIVDFLNEKSKIRYVGRQTDISFSTAGRTWINSDGKRNMPSGEVFTSPVETSVSGQVYFDFPTVYQGRDVEGVRLTVEDGEIVAWSAEVGQDVLDEVFEVDGARVFGEVAIGTNGNIQEVTKRILFDEKIGGSIHMAVGASYPETGGLNDSAVHWDLIKDMKAGGQIFADDVLIYENGAFIF